LCDHVGEHAAFTQWIDNGAALFDGLADLHQRFFEYRIAGGAGGNGQSLEDRHAGGDERSQGSGKAGHSDLAQQHAEDGEAQQ